MKFSKKNLPKILFVAALIFLAVKFLKKSEYATATALTYEQEQAKKSIDRYNELITELNKTRSKSKKYALCSTKSYSDMAAYNCGEYYRDYPAKGTVKRWYH